MTPQQWLAFLQKSDEIELDSYVGNHPVLSPEESRLHTRLKEEIPLDIRLALPRGECHEALYDIGQQLFKERLMSYPSLADLRQGIERKLLIKTARDCFRDIEEQFPMKNFRLLTVLPTGVYIGEPEDFYHFRQEQEKASFTPLYPLQGFGKLLGNISFKIYG